MNKTFDLKKEIIAIEGLIDLGLENDEYKSNITVGQMYKWLSELEYLRNGQGEEWSGEEDYEDWEEENDECISGTCVCAETSILNSVFFGEQLTTSGTKAIIQSTEDNRVREYLERLIRQFSDFKKLS